MPGHYDKAIRVPGLEATLAQAAAHQLCQAILPLVHEHFPRGSAFEPRVDGQANGDLTVTVVRGAFTGRVSSTGGNDMLCQDGRTVRQYLLRVAAGYENAAVAGALQFSEAAEYYSQTLATFVLGTLLAVASNGLFVWYTSVFSVAVCAGLTFASYGIAWGLGAFCGDTIGGIFIQFQQRRRAVDADYAVAEADWVTFVAALTAVVEDQAAAIEAGRIAAAP